MDNEFIFKVVKHLGVLETYPTGWRREVNLVAWNSNPAKFDIRDWDENHKHMSRGLTLHEGEMKALLNIFKDYKF